MDLVKSEENKENLILNRQFILKPGQIDVSFKAESLEESTDKVEEGRVDQEIREDKISITPLFPLPQESMKKRKHMTEHEVAKLNSELEGKLKAPLNPIYFMFVNNDFFWLEDFKFFVSPYVDIYTDLLPRSLNEDGSYLFTLAEFWVMYTQMKLDRAETPEDRKEDLLIIVNNAIEYHIDNKESLRNYFEETVDKLFSKEEILDVINDNPLLLVKKKSLEEVTKDDYRYFLYNPDFFIMKESRAQAINATGNSKVMKTTLNPNFVEKAKDSVLKRIVEHSIQDDKYNVTSELGQAGEFILPREVINPLKFSFSSLFSDDSDSQDISEEIQQININRDRDDVKSKETDENVIKSLVLENSPKGEKNTQITQPTNIRVLREEIMDKNPLNIVQSYFSIQGENKQKRKPAHSATRTQSFTISIKNNKENLHIDSKNDENTEENSLDREVSSDVDYSGKKKRLSRSTNRKGETKAKKIKKANKKVKKGKKNK